MHGVERKRRQGRRSTHALYARVGVREFYRGSRRQPKVHVELSDGTRWDDVHFAIVTNADPWTYIGNLPLRPTSHVTLDNELDVYARRRMGTPGMLFSMARMLGGRPHVGHRGAYVGHDLEHITLIADEPMPFQVDGDALDLREKVTFRSVPQAISMVVPDER